MGDATMKSPHPSCDLRGTAVTPSTDVKSSEVKSAAAEFSLNNCCTFQMKESFGMDTNGETAKKKTAKKKTAKKKTAR